MMKILGVPNCHLKLERYAVYADGLWRTGWSLLSWSVFPRTFIQERYRRC